MQPEIRYATATDGASIAFCTLGEGAPLVVLSDGPWSTIEFEWKFPVHRAWLDELAAIRRIVRYDIRGTGLSDTAEPRFELESQVLDLEAVVDQLELEKFALFGSRHAGPAAIVYAARHPDRISHLILWCSYARGSDHMEPSRAQAIRSLMDKDWELYLETKNYDRLGWLSSEEAHSRAELIGENWTEDDASTFHASVHDVDVTPLLPQISSPTLVLHRRGLTYPVVDVARNLASAIPNARLVLMEGNSVLPFLGDAAAVMTTVDNFVNEGRTKYSPQNARPMTSQVQLETLSQRELEVLELLSAGKSNHEISEELVIGLGTVKTHVHKIFGKLGVKNRTQASARGKELNLLP